MAPWALMKLLHPFTPDDILLSQRIKSTLNLPPSTSQFVLALSTSRSSDNVVYVLSVEKLSERSIDDVHGLVAAVNPNSVVAFVDAQYLTEVVEEGQLLDSPTGLAVPTSYVDLIRNCFIEKIKASVYETRARLKVLESIFGTTFYGNVFAARKAAEDAQAQFSYFQVPSAAAAFLGDEDEGEGAVLDVRASTNIASIREKLWTRFSAILRDNRVENVGGVLPRPNRPFRSEDLTFLSSSATSSLVGKVRYINDSPDGPKEEGWPSFAAPFYPLFVDLHQLFTETPGVNQALNFVTKVFSSVEEGDGVDHEDLSRARLFRVAVESVRVCWNSFVRQERGGTLKSRDFSQLPVEEKCQALLAHALQTQAQKFGTVVAVVDASNVPGIRRHWNTPIPADVAAYAEYCFVGLDSQEIARGGGRASNRLENSETKAVVAVGVGAGTVAMARLVSLPHWASLSASVMKVISLKVPTVLKLAWVQMKHQAAVAWATPASNVVAPVLKGAAKFVPSSGAKATIVKSASSASSGAKAMALKSAAAENVRVLFQHSMLASVEKASLHAIKTAFYSLMRNRQANNVGARPWLVFGSSLAVAGGFFMHGEEVKDAIRIIPAAPGVIRLGRGLEKLEQASGVVDDYEGSGWWNRVYETLYRNNSRRY